AMPLGVRLKYLAPQVVFVGSRHPRLRRRVSPLLHYTIIGIAPKSPQHSSRTLDGLRFRASHRIHGNVVSK
ncbi:MAG: hypothetical protein WA869_14760, partial [Alloacidobacterium sp.]